MSANGFKPVIGLEVHAQVLTGSKMYCSCSAAYSGAPPNTHVCAVCAGMPGALPVINRAAVHSTVLTGLALNCRIAEHSKFDRKNYQYPDLPKGYQITQYDMPIALGGWLEYEAEGKHGRCGIIRVHLEEDTGKLLHPEGEEAGVSLVDYNRSGVPLLEIVSEPDLESPQEARQYFATLRRILMYLGVNDGNLQEGSMRADVNVSLQAPDGTEGTKIEIKNLNSFRSVERALEYEIERQRQVLEAGGQLTQETRGWVEREEITVGQRSKEYAHDYRYFPEPDLPPLVFTADFLECVRAQLPELPEQRNERFVRELGLSAATASVLTDERPLADFFEEVLTAAPGAPSVPVANWLTGDYLAHLRERNLRLNEAPVTAAKLGGLMRLISKRIVGGPAAKQALEEMFNTGQTADEVVDRLDLRSLADEDALLRLIDDAIAQNAEAVADYRRGKTKALQAIVGKVMGLSRGTANPQRVRELLETRLQSE